MQRHNSVRDRPGTPPPSKGRLTDQGVLTRKGNLEVVDRMSDEDEIEKEDEAAVKLKQSSPWLYFFFDKKKYKKQQEHVHFDGDVNPDEDGKAHEENVQKLTFT